MPRPLSRNLLPACDPAGIFNSTTPPGVGVFTRGAERRFPGRHRQIEVQVAAVDSDTAGGAEIRPRCKDRPGGGAGLAGRLERPGPLAGETDGLSGQDALGYLHVEHALAHRQPSLGVDLGHAQRETPRPTVERRVEIEHHLGMMVLAPAGIEACARPAYRPAPALARPNSDSKKSL